MMYYDETPSMNQLEEKKPIINNFDLRFHCDQSGHCSQKCLQVVKTYLIVTFIFKEELPKNTPEMLNSLMKHQQSK